MSSHHKKKRKQQAMSKIRYYQWVALSPSGK